MRKVGRYAAFLLLGIALTGTLFAEDLPAPSPDGTPTVDVAQPLAPATDDPAAPPVADSSAPVSGTPSLAKPQGAPDCRWKNCLWQPAAFESDAAEKRGLTGTCEARAQALAELDLTHFSVQIPETHEWVLTQVGPLIDQTLHLREQYGCAAWPAGFERVASWDGAIGSICPIASAVLSASGGPASAPALQSTRGALNQCLSALLLFRAGISGALHGEDAPDTFQDSRIVAGVFQSELYSESPRLDRLSALLERFLTILPGDVAALTRLSSLYFAAWAKSPTSTAAKANVDRTVSRLELYTLKLDDLYRPELQRAIADHSALAMRQWALKLTEARIGADTAPYFLAWSSYLDGDRKKAQRYLRDALATADGTWNLETRVGLKRLLSRDAEVSTRPPFVGPSIREQLPISIGTASDADAKAGKAWAPGESVISGGGDKILLYGNDIEQNRDLPEVKEAMAEIQDHGRPVRTDMEDFLYNSAVAAIENGQSAVAKAAIDDLTLANPDNPSLANLSRALVLKAKLRSNPEDSESALLLGQVYYQEKQYAAAAALMREVLAHNPGNARAKVSLQHFQDLHEWEDRLLADIKSHPVSEKSLYRYACFLFREERWRDAERVLDSVRAVSPDSGRVTLMRRKIREILRIGNPAQRTADVYDFLSNELKDSDLEFPRDLAGEMLAY